MADKCSPNTTRARRNPLLADGTGGFFLPLTDMSGSTDGKLQMWLFGQDEQQFEYEPVGTSKITQIHFDMFGNKFGATDANGMLGMWRFGTDDGAAQPFKVNRQTVTENAVLSLDAALLVLSLVCFTRKRTRTTLGWLYLRKVLTISVCSDRCSVTHGLHLLWSLFRNFGCTPRRPTTSPSSTRRASSPPAGSRRSRATSVFGTCSFPTTRPSSRVCVCGRWN